VSQILQPARAQVWHAEKGRDVLHDVVVVHDVLRAQRRSRKQFLDPIGLCLHVTTFATVVIVFTTMLVIADHDRSVPARMALRQMKQPNRPHPQIPNLRLIAKLKMTHTAEQKLSHKHVMANYHAEIKMR